MLRLMNIINMNVARFRVLEGEKGCCVSLDSVDRRILRVLQENGRISNADLADKIHLSASACHRRVQRLEVDKYIDRYVALVDTQKAECPMTIMVEITLSSQADEVLEGFEKAIARIPEVLECYLMTGSADYLLKVVARDTEGFAMLHRKHLASLPGVGQMKSSIALRTVCNTTALPI